jgi:hypothetical protein
MNNKHNKELFEILDEALDRVLKGEDLHAVLADYPRHAAELEPLLTTALETRSAAAITPRAEFRQRAAIEFQKAIQQVPVKTSSIKEVAKPRRGLFGWGMAGTSVFAVILAVLISGTGVVAASTNAMPDSPLYSVKLAVENVQLAFTPSDEGKTELLAQFNDRRIDELVDMAGKGNVAEINVLNSRIASNMNQMSDLSGGFAANYLPEGDTRYGAATEGSEKFTFMTSMADTSATAPQTTVAKPTAVQTTVPAATAPPPKAIATRTPDNNVNSPPSPNPAATQPPQVTPTLTVILPQPTTTNLSPESPGDDNRSEDNQKDNHDRSNDKWDQLKKKLSEKQIKNLRSLLEAYQNASDSSRPEILKSIKIIILGYGLENNEVIDAILQEYGLTLDTVLG